MWSGIFETQFSFDFVKREKLQGPPSSHLFLLMSSKFFFPNKVYLNLDQSRVCSSLWNVNLLIFYSGWEEDSFIIRKLWFLYKQEWKVWTMWCGSLFCLPACFSLSDVSLRVCEGAEQTHTIAASFTSFFQTVEYMVLGLSPVCVWSQGYPMRSH